MGRRTASDLARGKSEQSSAAPPWGAFAKTKGNRMEELISLWLKRGRDLWPTRFGLFAALVLVVVILFPIFTGTDISRVSILEWVLLAVALFLVIATWHFSTTVPKVPRNRVGFGVAIYFESQRHAKTVHTDLLNRLRE
jgi:hypothetical protein